MTESSPDKEDSFKDMFQAPISNLGSFTWVYLHAWGLCIKKHFAVLTT